MNDKLSSLLNKIGRKEKKDVVCKGRMPDTRRKCGETLYQTDGEYLYLNGLILNKGQRRQRIECDNCGETSVWTRNPEFDKKEDESSNKFRRKTVSLRKNY